MTTPDTSWCALGENSYGKSRIRMVRVRRQPERHDLWDLTVDVACAGDFLAAHANGDNRLVLPTDTMKNTVYALAKEEGSAELERFGSVLAKHFLTDNVAVQRVQVTLAERPWRRIEVGGGPHRHAFTPAGGEARTARVVAHRDAPLEIESGIAGMILLKTTDSAFSGFRRDRFTTLRDAPDRIFATSVSARWSYLPAPPAAVDLDFGTVWRAVNATLAATFAEHRSASVQHTMYAMGQAALAARPELASIHLSLPNLHHFLVDLEPFGLENRDEIYVATEAPYGLIEATIQRSTRG